MCKDREILYEEGLKLFVFLKDLAGWVREYKGLKIEVYCWR